MSVCPHCTGQVAHETVVCPACGRNLQSVRAPSATPRKPSRLRRASPYLTAAALLLGIIVAILYPAVQQAREAARRSSCKCNLKILGLALHNYHDAHGCFPPAWLADSQGRPMHSWRVLILPYIDQAALYNRYNFAEPWDGPNNVKLLDEIPPVYKCPSHIPRAPA